VTDHGRLGRAWERARRAWHELTGPLPENERAESHRCTRQRYVRRLRRRRILRRWGRQLSWVDPAKQPIAVIRWFAVLGVALAWWAQGAVTTPVHKWLPPKPAVNGANNRAWDTASTGLDPTEQAQVPRRGPDSRSG
jgi:hypothetical protein